MPRGARMAIHKFKIGETVFLEHSLDVPGGAYVVTKRLPERDGEFNIKSRRPINALLARAS